MNANGYGNIPHELCYWITFLTKILPLRSQGTFVELLIGAMLSPTDFVTDAYLIVNMVNHWTSYYKWLRHLANSRRNHEQLRVAMGNERNVSPAKTGLGAERCMATNQTNAASLGAFNHDRLWFGTNADTILK